MEAAIEDEEREVLWSFVRELPGTVVYGFDREVRSLRPGEDLHRWCPTLMVVLDQWLARRRR